MSMEFGLDGDKDKRVDLICFYKYFLESEAIAFVSRNNTNILKHVSEHFSGTAVCVSCGVLHLTTA